MFVCMRVREKEREKEKGGMREGDRIDLRKLATWVFGLFCLF